MHQGGQECRQVDSALLPDLPGKPRSSATLRLGVQPQELPPPAGTSKVCPVWSLTTLKEKLVKIGAKVTRHAKYVTFQLVEVAVPRQLFALILERIGRFSQSPVLCPSGEPRSLRRDGGTGCWRMRRSAFATTAKKGPNPMLKTAQTPHPIARAHPC